MIPGRFTVSQPALTIDFRKSAIREDRKLSKERKP